MVRQHQTSDSQLRTLVPCGVYHRAGQRPDPVASPRHDVLSAKPNTSCSGAGRIRPWSSSTSPDHDL